MSFPLLVLLLVLVLVLVLVLLLLLLPPAGTLVRGVPEKYREVGHPSPGRRLVVVVLAGTTAAAGVAVSHILSTTRTRSGPLPPFGEAIGVEPRPAPAAVARVDELALEELVQANRTSSRLLPAERFRVHVLDPAQVRRYVSLDLSSRFPGRR